MDTPDISSLYLNATLAQLNHYKDLGEKTFAQLEEADFHLSAQPSHTNSIANLIKHLSGYMTSRWTNFLTTDGEKQDRNRDEEFETTALNKAQLIAQWESGWNVLFSALDQINDSNLSQLIFIRGEAITVLEALQKQLSHNVSHIGQIIYQAKIIKGESFKNLSIPLGASADFLAEAFQNRALRILVPIDFSDASINALNFAIDFANTIPARIWVTHVVFPHLNPGINIADEGLQNQVEQAKDRLDNFLASIETKGIQIDGAIEVGFVVDAILEEQEKKKIDITLLGNTGIGHGIANAFGSTAAQLAFKSSSKVLMVPLGSVFQKPKLIVLANDQSELKLTQVETAIQFSQKINSELELVHVGKPETKKAKSVFENLLNTLALPIKHTLSNQNERAILQELNQYAEERQADWMVMVSRERSFWKKILRPDGGKEIIGSIDRPLLVIR